MLLKFFFLVLCLVAVYTFSTLCMTAVQLRSLRKKSHSVAATRLQQSFAVARVRCVKVKQLIEATSYVFWFIFFLTLPSVTLTFDMARIPVIWSVVRELLFRVSFAANVFGVFVILHFAEWIVSSRVSSLALSTELETLP